MVRLVQVCSFVLAVLFAGQATAQEKDSIFRDYADYADFVDGEIMKRNFTSLILRLGGRDEYTPEELAATQRQMEGIWPRDFTQSAVFNREDLGGGVSHEGRIYWNGTQYGYFYALLHQREDALIVINFVLNSSSTPVMERF